MVSIVSHPSDVAELDHRFARSLLEVAPDVACLQLSIVNVVLVGSPSAGDRGWVLVDTGMPFSGPRILEAAAERFGRARPSAIVLTHGHFDHVGTVEQLAEHWYVPVYAHPLEMPYLTGRSKYHPPDPAVGGGAMAWMAPLYPRGPVDLGERVEELPPDHTVPHMPGWRWIHTPGHAPGHISLFRDSDRLLIAGDAFVTLQQESFLSVMTQPKHVHRPPAYYTPDWISAGKSVRDLAELEPQFAITGHGLPMEGQQLQSELHDLANHFEVVIPDYGRYVDQPAVMDERGVVSVPPRVWNPRQIAAVATTVLAAGLLLARPRRSDRR